MGIVVEIYLANTARERGRLIRLLPVEGDVSPTDG